MEWAIDEQEIGNRLFASIYFYLLHHFQVYQCDNDKEPYSKLKEDYENKDKYTDAFQTDEMRDKFLEALHDDEAYANKDSPPCFGVGFTFKLLTVGSDAF